MINDTNIPALYRKVSALLKDIKQQNTLYA
jgi:hypothetical protein